MDQGAVTSRFVDFTAVLRVYNVEILGSRLQCGVGVLGGIIAATERLSAALREVTWRFSSVRGYHRQKLSKQVTRNPAGGLKTCWEDLNQFLREYLSRVLHLSGWQKLILRRELKNKF